MLFGRKTQGGPEWLLVFLGNPGPEYEYTRHNAGFLVADALAEELKVPVQRLRFRALTADVKVAGCRALMMKPVTYMNLSGEAVRQAADFYKIPPQRVLAVSDETALPLGRLRIRAGGSAGGHNGLKSLIQHLGTDQFPRLRLGVGGKPHQDYDMADWVLAKLTGEDRAVMDGAVRRAAQAVSCILAEGTEVAMSRFNGGGEP